MTEGEEEVAMQEGEQAKGSVSGLQTPLCIYLSHSTHSAFPSPPLSA